MAKLFHIEIVTPDKLFYEGDIESVLVRTTSGDKEYMADHAWETKLLVPGILKIKEAGKKEMKLGAASFGYVDVRDKVIVYLDAAEWPDEIDITRALAAKERAEEMLRRNNQLITDLPRARASLSRAINRVNIRERGMPGKSSRL